MPAMRAAPRRQTWRRSAGGWYWQTERCAAVPLTPLGNGESLVTVCEGKYHQVRRMMASRGMTVTYLERRQEGALTLGNLPRGCVRELNAREIRELEESAGLAE